MSRYLHVQIEIEERAELLLALDSLPLKKEVAEEGELLMLEGSLECAGEPVEIRLPAGTMHAVEDFGFAKHEGRYRLVCGEFDQEKLESTLLPALEHEIAVIRTKARAEALGLEVEESRELDGTRRILLRDR